MLLYLGLDPPPNAFHYPVIRTVKRFTPELSQAKELWPQFTHLLFTSKTAVRYLDWDLQGKTAIAIGESTANEIRIRGSFPLVAPEAQQEGVIELLDRLSLDGAFFCYPKSKRSRPLLTDYLQQKKIRFFALDLYDTILQRPEPPPSLDLFDEIVFTSPSTVDGFLKIYGYLPDNKKLTAVGPVTAAALRELPKTFAN